MPRPPRIKIRGKPPVPVAPNTSDLLMENLPEEVKQELKKKGAYTQFRMPIDIWARLRARQIEMNNDAREIMKKSNLNVDPNILNIPMTEVMRRSFEHPVMVGDPAELLGMIHKKGKGRIFR